MTFFIYITMHFTIAIFLLWKLCWCSIVPLSRIFMSRIFHPCHLVPYLHVSHFPSLLFGAEFSCSVFSASPCLLRRIAYTFGYGRPEPVTAVLLQLGRLNAKRLVMAVELSSINTYDFRTIILRKVLPRFYCLTYHGQWTHRRFSLWSIVLYVLCCLSSRRTCMSTVSVLLPLCIIVSVSHCIVLSNKRVRNPGRARSE